MKNSLKNKSKKLKAGLVPENGTNGEPSKPVVRFTKEQLDKALLDSFDLMQRVLLDNTYVLVGEAAKCLKENRGLDCGSIDFIIEKRHITKEVLSAFKDWVKGKVDERGFEYIFEGVPVRCSFIEKEYPYFTFADQKVYGPEVYKIPNQWEEYWQHKGEII